jgi:hypothetical protein
VVGISGRQRIVIGFAGVLIFGTGAVAVFVTSNGPGTAALLAIGAGFGAFAVLGDRLKSVQFPGFGITLRDIAHQTLDLAQDAERRGDVVTAEGLRTAAQAFEDLANRYCPNSTKRRRWRTGEMVPVPALLVRVGECRIVRSGLYQCRSRPLSPLSL